MVKRIAAIHCHTMYTQTHIAHTDFDYIVYELYHENSETTQIINIRHGRWFQWCLKTTTTTTTKFTNDLQCRIQEEKKPNVILSVNTIKQYENKLLFHFVYRNNVWTQKFNINFNLYVPNFQSSDRARILMRYKQAGWQRGERAGGVWMILWLPYRR